MSYFQSTSLFTFSMLLICVKSINNLLDNDLNLLIGLCYFRDVWGEPPSPIEGWTTVPTGAPTSSCNGQTIIGGHNLFSKTSYAQKTYTGLPVHNTVIIQFDAYFLDSWDGGEYYRLVVDGTTMYEKLHRQGQDGGTTDVCGWSAADWITTVYIGPFSHTSATIELYFTSNINESPNNEAWGFKNIQITFDTLCNSACIDCFGTDISQCYSCNDGWYLSGTTCVTTCPTDQWRNPSGNLCESKFF